MTNESDDWQLDVVEVEFFPSQDSLKTIFKVKQKDIPRLVEILIEAYERTEPISSYQMPKPPK